MLAIAIRYLTGRAAAASVTDREEAEWPPHPGRLFMALVASWGSSGRRPPGQAALEWLETQPPPQIHAPPADKPDVMQFFVPVNDKRGGMLLAENRKERHFPSAIPEPDTVYFIWPGAEPTSDQRAALELLCANMTYLGRSSSLVQAWLSDEVPAPTHVPTGGRAAVRLRIATPGRFARLEDTFRAGSFPDAGAWQAYGPPEATNVKAPMATAQAGFFALRRTSGPRLGLESTLAVVAAFRGSVLSTAGDNASEIITGHDRNGAPTKRPHLAIVPLADVGHEHADGHLLGLAAVLPGTLDEAERDACLSAVAEASARPLVMGTLGEWSLESEPPDEPSRRALDPLSWTRPSARWATVTPVVLDRFPKADGDTETTIALACERAGLPRPRDVIAVPVSPVLGVMAARDFPPDTGRPEKPRRWHTHAILTFDTPVAGPVIVGAGRFRGYGLCRPLGGTSS